MNALKKTVKLSVLAAAMAIGSQASAHEVVSDTQTLAPLAGGATREVVLACPHQYQYVVTGGAQFNKQLSRNGPLELTASYPKTTRSWAFEITNRAFRPTGAKEVNMTFTLLCDYRH